MVQMYTIAGRQVGSHVLAMVTLGLLGGTTAFFMGGGEAKKTTTPPINAKSPDEEKFITDFLKSADEGAKKGADAQKH